MKTIAIYIAAFVWAFLPSIELFGSPHLAVIAKKKVAVASDSPGTTNLLAWWELNVDENPWQDSHTGSYDLTETGTVTLDTTNKVVGAGAMAKGSGANYLYNSALFSETYHQSDFTAGCWVWMNSSAGNWGVMGQYGSGTSRHWCIYYNTSANRYEFYMVDSAGTSYIATGPTYTTTGEWKFTVVRRSGNDMDLFIDGSMTGTTSDTFDGAEVSGGYDFELGTIVSNSALAIDGKIDEAFIYTEALTDAEIDWLYNSGSGRSFSDL